MAKATFSYSPDRSVSEKKKKYLDLKKKKKKNLDFFFP